jgi:hypothetical protein
MQTVNLKNELVVSHKLLFWKICEKENLKNIHGKPVILDKTVQQADK